MVVFLPGIKEEHMYYCAASGGDVPADAEVKQWSEDWDAAGEAACPPAYFFPSIISFF